MKSSLKVTSSFWNLWILNNALIFSTAADSNGHQRPALKTIFLDTNWFWHLVQLKLCCFDTCSYSLDYRDVDYFYTNIKTSKCRLQGQAQVVTSSISIDCKNSTLRWNKSKDRQKSFMKTKITRKIHSLCAIE